MKNKMNDDETFEFEGRRYVNPTVSRDKQMDFVQTLRDTVGANTAQIAESTERLGTDIPSSMGGLTGSGSYFTQRYQTTPLETRANTLKATAQAKALNDLMSNYEQQYANRAKQAYRNAARRAKTASAGGGGDEDGLPDNVDVSDPDDAKYSGLGSLTMSWEEGDEPATGYGDPEGKYTKAVNQFGHIIATDDPNYAQADDGYYYNISNVPVPFALELRFPTEEARNRWRANQVAATFKSGGW